VRAAVAQDSRAEAIADFVQATRVRRGVLTLCDAAIASDTLKEDAVFWVNASKVEALLGLARTAESEALQQQLIGRQPPPAPWMIDTMNNQLERLRRLLVDSPLKHVETK
jgi:hypothetical protein